MDKLEKAEEKILDVYDQITFYFPIELAISTFVFLSSFIFRNWILVAFTAPIFIYNYKEYLNSTYKLFYIIGQNNRDSIQNFSLKYKYKFLAYFMMSVISFIYLMFSVVAIIINAKYNMDHKTGEFVFKLFGLI